MQVAITEGCEAYADQEILEQLASLTADAYRHVLDRAPALHDGKGNCWVVAACAHGVAQALELRSALFGGQVFGEDDLPKFPKDGHYWAVVNDDVVVESPNPDLIMVWPRHLIHRRLVPLDRSPRKMADMRGARKLQKLSDSVCRKVRRKL